MNILGDRWPSAEGGGEMLTKDDVSDLKSLILRVEESALQLRNATLAKQDADRALAGFLSKHTERTTAPREPGRTIEPGGPQ